MNKGKSEKISIANIVSVVGLAVLAFLAYLGCSFKWPEQNIGINMLLALCPAAVAAFLLWMMTHAKGVENNFRGWLIVEVVSLLAFVGTAVWGGSWVMPYFVVNQRSEELQNAAEDDLTAMENEIDRFIARQTEKLNTMVTGIENALEDRVYDEQVEALLDRLEITSELSLETWAERQQEKIDSIEYYGLVYRSSWRDDISEMRSDVSGWDLFTIPEIAVGMARLAGTDDSSADKSESICGILNAISRNSDLCRIEAVRADYEADEREEISSPYKDSYRHSKYGKVYRVVGFGRDTYDVDLIFPSMLKKGGFSWGGFAVIVLVYILILFNYIFAYRSKKGSLEAGANYEHGAAL